MNRNEAWAHVCAVINDRGETVDPCAPSNAALDLARLVVWVTRVRSQPFGPRGLTVFADLATTIVVIHRDPGLRLGDEEAAQLAQAYRVKSGHGAAEPAFIL